MQDLTLIMLMTLIMLILIMLIMRPDPNHDNSWVIGSIAGLHDCALEAFLFGGNRGE